MTKPLVIEDEKISQANALVWEVYSSSWSKNISIKWLQDLASKYFAWKVNRKYKRYIANLEERARVKAISENKTQEEIKEWMKKR